MNTKNYKKDALKSRFVSGETQPNKKLSTFITIVIGMFFITSTNAQWTGVSSGISTHPQKGMVEMIAVNDQVAWALAYQRNRAFKSPLTDFTRTVDGGKSWIAGSVSSMPDQYLVGLAPLSGTKAYMISSGNNGIGYVLKTTDGGITWTDLKVASFNVFFENIVFFNNMDGVVFGVSGHDSYMVVFTTNDGGNSWSQVPDTNLPAHDDAEEFYAWSSSVIGDTLWTVSTEARVWKSTDKGLHWVANPTPLNEAVASNIKMRDAMHGLWGINDELYRTSDGGITWTEVNHTGTFFTFDLAYVPGTASTYVSTGGDTAAIADALIGFNGALNGIGSSYSLDEGNTWITIDTGVDHLALAMVNSYTGFSGSFEKSHGYGEVFDYTGSAIGYSCGDNMTQMCNHGKSVCVPHNDIQRILNHGGSFECDGERLTATMSNDNAVKFYPNPFTDFTTITFELPGDINGSLKIFDVEGRLIRTLADDAMRAGAHKLTWDARDENGNALSPGIYFLQLQSSDFSQTEKLIVVK